jgi:hypothetical protein
VTYTNHDIEQMKRTRRLKLSRLEIFEHYFVVFFLCLVPGFTLYQIGTKYFETDRLVSSTDDLFAALPFLILATVAYFNQHRRLNFKAVQIEHTIDDFREAVTRTSTSLQWEH